MDLEEKVDEFERTIDNLSSLYTHAGFTFEEDDEKRIIVKWNGDETQTETTTYSYRIERSDDLIISKMTIHVKNKTNSEETHTKIKFSSQYNGPIMLSKKEDLMKKVFEDGHADNPLLSGYYKNENGEKYPFSGIDAEYAAAVLKIKEELLMAKIPKYFELKDCIFTPAQYRESRVPWDKFLKNNNLFK